MKVELITNGPFFAGIYAYDDLFTFTGDSVYIKTDNSSLVGGHAVEIVGWVDKGVDTRSGFSEYGYWVCKNSWGTTDWCPEYDFKGYFPIRMGTNECHIESLCGAALPNIEKNSKVANTTYTSFSQMMQDIQK